jgi:site-specific DNA-methyltransferase (adenine-specific)
MYNPQGVEEYGKINKRGYTGSNWKELNLNIYKQKLTNYPTQIIKFFYDKDKLHPTQKPVALCEYLIKTYTNEGDLVLDNCIGSGTTAVACIKTNRNFIGIELSEEYCKIANDRIDKSKRENLEWESKK